MSKKFANESPKKQKDPVATYLPPGFKTQVHSGLADEGVDQTRIETGAGVKEKISGQKTKVADAEHQAGDGGRARPRN